MSDRMQEGSKASVKIQITKGFSKLDKKYCDINTILFQKFINAARDPKQCGVVKGYCTII